MKKTLKPTMLFMFIITVMFLLFSCSDKNPFNPITKFTPNQIYTDLVQGEIWISFHQGVDVDDFLLSHSIWDLRRVFSFLGGVSQSYFTFNYDLINTSDMVYILEDDVRVREVEIFHGWVPGEFKVTFAGDIDMFLSYYSNYNLKIVNKSLSTNDYIISFNKEKINEFDLREMLVFDNMVSQADFNGPKRVWRTGYISCTVLANQYNSFYKHYFINMDIFDLSTVIVYNDGRTFVSMRFDHNKIDEFKLIDFMANDYRIERIGFDYFAYPQGGIK